MHAPTTSVVGCILLPLCGWIRVCFGNMTTSAAEAANPLGGLRHG